MKDSKSGSLNDHNKDAQLDSTVSKQLDEVNNQAQAVVGDNVAEAATTQISGRSVFAIETTPAGVVVRTAFMTDDKQLLNAPMIFPDSLYAFNVIDDLKRQVAEHFARAARIGAQVMAQSNQPEEQNCDD